MKSDFVEVKCGNCRFWYPWKALGGPSFVKKAKATGCDGSCKCYEGREAQPGPRNSFDTVTASHCKFYSN